MKLNTPVSYTVKLEARSDGTYRQEISVASQTNVVEQTGTWALNGAHVTFENILLEEFDFDKGVGKWEPRTATWWLIDAYDNDRKVALFGGLFGDPDAFQQFKRLR